ASEVGPVVGHLASDADRGGVALGRSLHRAMLAHAPRPRRPAGPSTEVPAGGPRGARRGTIWLPSCHMTDPTAGNQSARSDTPPASPGSTGEAAPVAGRLGALDGLRGLALIGMLAWHAEVGWVRGG